MYILSRECLSISLGRCSEASDRTNQTTLESLTPYLLLRHIPQPRSTKPASPEYVNQSPQMATSPSTPSSGASYTTPTFAPLATPPSTPPSPKPVSSRNGHDPSSPYYFPSPPAPQIFRTDSPDSTLVARNAVTRLQEHDLTLAQRRRVRYAAGKIRLYDLGSVGRNWACTVLGGDRRRRKWHWWIALLICGGRGLVAGILCCTGCALTGALAVLQDGRWIHLSTEPKSGATTSTTSRSTGRNVAIRLATTPHQSSRQYTHIINSSARAPNIPYTLNRMIR